MIVVRLKGGLGNQLFQFAAGFSLARRHDAPLLLDACDFAVPPAPGRPWRTFDLGPYRLPSAVRHRRVGRLVDRLVRPVWHFDGDGYEPAVFQSLPRSVVLDGYFQHPGYFESVSTELRAALAPPPGSFDDGEPRPGPSTVAVQVRRDDYVSVPENSRLYNVCGPGYYRAAWEVIRSRVPDAKAWLFTDDEPWAARELAFLEAERIDGEASGSGCYVRKFERLRSCSHHVIANSSYGWWAAWLGAGARSVVVAPSEWRRGVSIQSLGLNLPGWHCL